jgi:TolA-binding protein
MAGAGLAAALGVTLGKAQESTPAASETPQAGTSTGNALDALLQKLDSIISQVKTDRDAVSSTIDVSVVDQLLTKATALRDQVASTASTDKQQAYQLAQAVVALARAAAAVIQAELSNYGLPSQQARASRFVANAHGQITEISDLVSNSTDANVTESIALAQQLYRAAYDAYNAGTYTKAMALARAASAVAFAAALAGGVAAGKFGIGREGPDEEDGPFGPGMPGGKKRGGRGHMERDMPDWGGQPDWGGPGETEQPVEVPAPNFTS